MTKPELINYFEQNAAKAIKWHRRNRYYYDDLKSFLRINIERGAKVLEVGSGTGELLAAVEPARGVGLDLSSEAIKNAHGKYLDLEFLVADIDKKIELKETFDYIILSDLIGYLEDIQTSFENLHQVCHPRTRLIVTQYNNLWWPVLKLGEMFGFKQKQPIINWIGGDDIKSILNLAGFEVIRSGRRLLFPKYVPFLSWFLNKIIGNLPILNYFCLIEYFILRPKMGKVKNNYFVSVIAPAKNEKGNIEDAVRRLPKMGKGMEIIFIEGHSSDGTWEEINRVAGIYKDEYDIKFFIQDGKGLASAVRQGFKRAKGDILMILDTDLTVEPEELPKFYEIMSTNQAEYVQGTRLIYPLEHDSMRFLNFLANKFFGFAFSWLIGQHISDTLCGTKVLFRGDYEKIAVNRCYFGDFDPFGDFDLIFGAGKLNLKLVELPVHYKQRKYGSPNISRFKHGLLLFKMLWLGVKKFKLK